MAESQKKKKIPTVEDLIRDILWKDLPNSYSIALKTQELLKFLIAGNEWKNALELMEKIKGYIKCIRNCLPYHMVSINVMRHFLKIIREEFDAGLRRKGVDTNLHPILTITLDRVVDYTEEQPQLQDDLLLRTEEYRMELESSLSNIIERSDQIFANDVIITYGKSSLVEQFLKGVAKKKPIHVIVVESSQVLNGHEMAASLMNIENIQVNLVPDSNIFNLMSRANKVVIGTHLVYSDGGLQTIAGVYNLAVTAKYFSVPVIVLTCLYKLVPQITENCDQCQNNRNAGTVRLWENCDTSKFNIHDPVFDYVPPELIQLFIVAHQNANAPPYVQRMILELYDKQDYNL